MRAVFALFALATLPVAVRAAPAGTAAPLVLYGTTTPEGTVPAAAQAAGSCGADLSHPCTGWDAKKKQDWTELVGKSWHVGGSVSAGVGFGSGGLATQALGGTVWFKKDDLTIVLSGVYQHLDPGDRGGVWLGRPGPVARR